MYTDGNILFYREIKNEVLVCVHTKAPRYIQKQKVTENALHPCKYKLLKTRNSCIIALCVSQSYSVLCGSLNTMPCPVLRQQYRVVHHKTVLDFH